MFFRIHIILFLVYAQHLLTKKKKKEQKILVQKMLLLTNLCLVVTQR